MTENIDIRMSNYMVMLSNPNISGKLDEETIENMLWAITNYAKDTSKEYAQEHGKIAHEIVMGAFKSINDEISAQADVKHML